MAIQSLLIMKSLFTVITFMVSKVLVGIPYMSIKNLNTFIHSPAEITYALLKFTGMQSLMVQHKALVVESLPAKLASIPGGSMFLPNMLVQSAGFDWAVAMGTGYLLRIPVHSFSVIIKTAGKLEGYTALLAINARALLSFLTPFLSSLDYAVFGFH